jgi:hypothetical protein
MTFYGPDRSAPSGVFGAPRWVALYYSRHDQSTYHRKLTVSSLYESQHAARTIWNAVGYNRIRCVLSWADVELVSQICRQLNVEVYGLQAAAWDCY